MKKVTLYLAAVFWHDFRVACVQRGVSASAIVNELIRDQLHRWAKQDEAQSDDE
jgi:hypothetical protein